MSGDHGASGVRLDNWILLMMRRRRARIYHTVSGQATRLGFDDPLRWTRHLARLFLIRAGRTLTAPTVLASFLVAVAVLLVAILSAPAPESQPSTAVVPSPAPAGPVAKASERAPREPPSPAARWGERRADDPAVSRHGLTLAPPFDIVDGQTFGNAELTIRLADIAAPERDAVCVGDNGHPWACGLAARAALNNLVRVAPVVCDVLDHPQGPADGRCRVSDSATLAGQLVLLGFARPSQIGAFAPELAEARQHRRGLWNGNWTYRARPVVVP